MKGRMAIIGDGDGVFVFRAAGMDAYREDGGADAAAVLHKIAQEHQVIFVTDLLAADMENEIAAYAREAYPIVLSVPSVRGGNGYGEKLLRKCSERALGMDILPRSKSK